MDVVCVKRNIKREKTNVLHVDESRKRRRRIIKMTMNFISMFL
jgi:hypothetical protein